MHYITESQLIILYDMIESDPVWAHPVHPSTRDQPPPTITHHHQIILTTWHLSIPHHSINTGHYCRECISIALKIHVNKSCWTLPLIASLHAKSTFQWYFCTSKCKTNVLTDVGKYLIMCNVIKNWADNLCFRMLKAWNKKQGGLTFLNFS